MPLFKVYIERNYVTREGFERYVRADTEDEAEAIAEAHANKCNNDCPDDCTETDGGGDDFKVAYTDATTDTPPEEDILT